MFNPTGLGLQIFNERYAAYEGESWDEACRRVAKWAASAENRDKISQVEEDFYRILREGLFMPGGRIWYAAGRPYAQALNCFVLPVSDSREGIGQLFYDTMVVSGTGGGIGVNFSPLRGRGATIHGMGGKSTGAVSFMKAQNSIGEQILAGGSRRTALMQCLNINHPDIMEFIKAKTQEHELNNANISIVIPKHLKDSDFTLAVRRGSSIPMMFNGHKLGELDAAELWGLIVENAHRNGEPGVLNGYYANQASSIGYAHPLISTNPCGEIWLPAYGCCDLGAIVLPRFVTEGGVFDYNSFADTVRIAVRFLDNVLTVNQYPLASIRETSQAERRIGLGIMGLHSMLLKQGRKYSESVEDINSLAYAMKMEAYEASINLAKEKGSFSLYSPNFVDQGFASWLPGWVKNKILSNGIRNCALLTVAPTGTTSMVQGVTSGIEPMFSPVYIRRRFVNGEVVGDRYTDSTLVISREYTEHMSIAEGAYDITPQQHFDVQIAVQREFDNAVSKTINLPKDYSADKLSSVWLDNLPLVKGATLYREGSRGNEPLEHVPLSRVLEVVSSWEGDIENEDGTKSIDPCVFGACDV